MIHDRYLERDTLVSVIQPGSSTAVLQLSSGMKIPLDNIDEQQHITEADKTEITVDSKSTKFVSTGNRRIPQGKIDPLFNKVIVPKGGEYQLELSDGTKVCLTHNRKSLSRPSSREIRVQLNCKARLISR